MNVGGFSEHQNKTSNSDRYKRYFFTARVPQVNVITMKRVFQQRSELQVAKVLIVHVLSSSYNVSRLELRNKRKATQQWSLCVSNDIVLNQVGVYHKRVYADNVVRNIWFVRSFSSQHRSKFVANIAPKNVSQVHTNICKARSFNCKVNLTFLCPSRHSNCDTSRAVIVSLLNEIVHGFNNICNRSLETGFQILKLQQLSTNFFIKKDKFFPCDILVH